MESVNEAIQLEYYRPTERMIDRILRSHMLLSDRGNYRRGNYRRGIIEGEL